MEKVKVLQVYKFMKLPFWVQTLPEYSCTTMRK